MILSGTTIAPGIAFGPAVLWTPTNEPVPRREIPKSAVAAEGHRLEHALRRARQELEQVAVRVEITAGTSAAAIFRCMN